MNDIINKLTEAQKLAMSIRHQSGGFSMLAEVLRQAGALINRWSLPSCQSIYLMNNNEAIVQQGTPLITGSYLIPQFNQEALILAIRKDQAGHSTFPEFLQASWEAGVIGYDVDFTARKVRYYGVYGESYVEEYPAVTIEI
jgi:uncharacterized protein YbcV (DUF1398 family)